MLGCCFVKCFLKPPNSPQLPLCHAVILSSSSGQDLNANQVINGFVLCFFSPVRLLKFISLYILRLGRQYNHVYLLVFDTAVLGVLVLIPELIWSTAIWCGLSICEMQRLCNSAQKSFRNFSDFIMYKISVNEEKGEASMSYDDVLHLIHQPLKKAASRWIPSI